MKQTFSFLIVSFLILNMFSSEYISISQSHAIDSNKNSNSIRKNCPCDDGYSEVKVKLMKRKRPPRYIKITGEDIIKLSSDIKTIEDIPKEAMTEIKENVSRYKGCIVFLDMKDLYASDMFPSRKIGELYYYFGICK